MTARGSDEERVVAFLEIMELGGDAPRIATRVDAAEPPRDWVDAYALLFLGRYVEALTAIAHVDDGSPGARGTRAQIEALCLGATDVPLVAAIPPDTTVGAMALFQLSEAAHLVGRIEQCSAMLDGALSAAVPRRARVWLRLAAARALLFRGEVAQSAELLALAAPDARSPLARRSVTCLRAVVAGFSGRAEAVVAEASVIRREVVPPRSYADSGIALMCALGLAGAGMVLAAGELLREGGGGPGLPLLPPTLRGYAYDVLVEAALAAGNPELAAWIMVDFDRIDFGANAQFRAAREAARARIEIAAGARGPGEERAERAARAALGAGVGLVGARAAAVATHARGAGQRGQASVDLLGASSADLRRWLDSVAPTDDEGVRDRRLDVEPAWDRLTRAQQAVARLAARGLRNQEIADQLVLSRRTVEGHLSAIFDRLGIADRVDIVRGGGDRPLDPAALGMLTARQAEIARELVAGAGNGAIAEHLGIHVKTVEKHVRGLYRALGVSGRAAAVGRLLESDQRRA